MVTERNCHKTVKKVQLDYGQKRFFYEIMGYSYFGIINVPPIILTCDTAAIILL